MQIRSEIIKSLVLLKSCFDVKQQDRGMLDAYFQNNTRPQSNIVWRRNENQEFKDNEKAHVG